MTNVQAEELVEYVLVPVKHDHLLMNPSGSLPALRACA